jgi:CheY-like chemotaxis protein
MDIKKRLFVIPELNTASRLARMDDKQLEQYVGELNKFIDAFPENEKKLRVHLNKKEVESITNDVKNFSKLLADIYADDLSEECMKHANGFKDSTFEKVNVYVTYLLSTLTALSIDIQVAIISDEDKAAMEAVKPSVNEIKIILAVDDDSFCLNTLKNAMINVQCNLICATNGSTALNMLRIHKPDLFVLDIEMPGMDGIELAGKIRGLGHMAPIVFITGNADKSYVLRAINAGSSDFIVKPFNSDNVVNRLKKFL